MELRMGARQAITVATGEAQKTLPSYEEPRGGGGGRSNTPSIVRSCALARVLAAVDRQPPIYRDWLYWTYGADGWQRFDSFRALVDELWHWYTSHYKKPAKAAAFRAMIPYLLDDMVHRHRCGWSKYTGDDICDAVGLKRSTWSAWKWKVIRIRSAIDEIDQKALEPVAREIDLWNRKVRGERAGEPVSD